MVKYISPLFKRFLLNVLVSIVVQIARPMAPPNDLKTFLVDIMVARSLLYD